MNKLFPLVLGLMLPVFGALAADDFTDQAVEFCKSKGGSYSMGSMVEEGDKYCRQVTCKKTTAADGRLQIPEGEKGPEANVEATKRVCISKSVVDGNFSTAGAGNTAGANSGSNSGSNSGANSGSNSGSGSGTGATASGSNSGSGSGSATGAITCEELEGEGRIQPGGLCYNECKSKRTGFLGLGGRKEGFERKECVECLLKYPGVYRVKREYLPKDANGKVIGDNSVDLGKGVTVKTGVIVCKDSTGKIVSVNGSACPPGMTIQVSGGAVSGSGNGTGTVIVTGGAVGGAVGGGSAGGGVQLPAYCNSTSRKDIEKCQEWMQQNRRFLCSSSGNPTYCMGGADIEISSRYDTSNCVNCQAGSRGKQSTLSGIAEIVGAIAPVASVGLGAYFGYKSNQAWAGAATAGFEQCRLDHNNYYQYLATNELPGLSPAQQAAMNCNGFGLGGYAGLGSAGLGGYYGAGYTPGFIGGMLGPYGGYNPYGMGGVVGGYVGGAVGGIIGGVGMTGGYVGGGYPGGMVGGAVAGGYVGGGYPGGMVGGAVAGGYVAGGYPGGMVGGAINGVSMAGGFNGGGYPGGMVGGYVAGGYNGGFNGGFQGGYQGGYVAGGMTGGMVNGISVAGGFNGGFQGGYAAGGMAGGYMAGGYTPGGYSGGYMAGGFNGGYQGGYVSGGYAAGGYAAGGYAAGGMAGGGYMDYNTSQQAANYDRMMQQQGTSFQMGMGGMGGYGGGFGSAGYYPSNVGVSLGGSFGIGGGFGGGYGGW